MHEPPIQDSVRTPRATYACVSRSLHYDDQSHELLIARDCLTPYTNMLKTREGVHTANTEGQDPEVGAGPCHRQTALPVIYEEASVGQETAADKENSEIAEVDQLCDIPGILR